MRMLKAAIDGIIKSLALSMEYQDETLSRLWTVFFGELDSHHLNPKEIQSPTNKKRSVYEYDSDSGRKSVSYAIFTEEFYGCGG